jgi:tetratricopeptide (TPR) repeat protein
MRRRFVSLVAVLTATVALPAGAHAQGEKQEAEIKAQPTRKQAAPARKAEEKGPGLGSEQFVRRDVKEMAEEKWQEAFTLLKKLIKATPDNDPAKPDLYYRLSEMYWERASSNEIRAFDEEGACLERAGGDKARENQCSAVRNQKLQLSEQYRDDAIKVYKAIVRNFPNYPRLDGVLFALAFNYQQKKQPDAAKKIYAELIKRFPTSDHVPDALLNLGEIFFEEGNVDSALKAYRKVVEAYPDSSVYGYALYKLGWCYFNKGDHPLALRQFLAVIEYTNKLERSGRDRKNRVVLKKEAQRDLVRTYVHIEGANPNKAVGFFRKVAPDNYIDLCEDLAELYADTGQARKSNDLYRQLIKLQSKSYRVVSYQIAIAYNTQQLGQEVDSVKELKRLVSLWNSAKSLPDAEPKRVASDGQRIEELSRGKAVEYHRLALKTKNEDHFAIAYDLYSDYIKAFPSGENAYTMTFYYAELLYKLKKWKEAAQNYERTLELNANGEFTKDAAHGTVLAYKKLLLGEGPRTGDTKGDLDADPATDDGGEAKPVEVQASKPIPEDYQRFIKACDLYTQYVKESEYLVDIMYDKARVYYDFNHFDKSNPVFKEISEKFVKHRLAVFAANLLLDTYNLQGEIDRLNAQVETYLKLYPPDRDPEFYALLVKLKQQATFKKCEGIERKQRKYVEAARCYKSYARQFKTSEYVDKALYNAALNYEREKKIEEAIQARLLLVNEVSGSPLVPKALYQIAGNLHALAIYSKASEAYEFYAAKFPQEENAKDALRNAAVFREGLGELDQAIKDYEAYLKLIGSDREKAAEVFFSLGRIYERQERWDQVVSHFNQFLRTYGKVARVDLVLEAWTRIGNAEMKGKRPNSKAAQKAYNSAYKTFLDLSDAEKRGLTTGLAAVAEARFKMAEAVFQEFEKDQLQIHPYKNVKTYVAKMSEKIAARTKTANEARTIYLEVIEFRSPNWAIAALARIGQMFQALANDIYNLEPPGSFDEEQKEIFKGTMAEKAAVVEGKAVEAYVLCMKKAQELKWFNQWSELAEKQLARLNPQEYRYNAEIRARPTAFGPDYVRAEYVETLPVQEVP